MISQNEPVNPSLAVHNRRLNADSRPWAASTAHPLCFHLSALSLVNDIASRWHLVYGHAASSNHGRGAFQVKFEFHRMRAFAEQLRVGPRTVVPREAIRRGMFDVMHSPI